MHKKSRPSLDPSIAKYYSRGGEKDRLNNNRLEKDRTLMILKKLMPSAPAVVLDIGGAAGAYAFPLASQGYEVHLIDPIPIHIEQAEESNCSSPFKLASCSLGDARQIDKSDCFADAVLLFGPLYHLIDLDDRLKALQEAWRVLKPGGMLFAVGISKFASFVDSLHKGVFLTKLKVIDREFSTGVHHKVSEGFDFGYLHHPLELKEEIQKCGFDELSILAVEGPMWHPHSIEKLLQNQMEWEHFLSTIEKIETEETLVGASAHMMVIGKKKKNP